jgi:SAM-dependent methyltransferase
MAKIIYDLNYPWLKTDDTHEIECFLCQGHNLAETKFKFAVNKKIFEIRCCLKDDLMFLSPQPGEKYSKSLYNNPDYYRGIDDMYGLKVDDERSTQIARIRLEEARHYSPQAESVLGIGCGHGHFLKTAVHFGFKSVAGIEFSDEAVSFCQKQGLAVFNSSMNKLPHLDRLYELVTMYSVLEHVEDPVVFLKEAKKYLSDNGVLIVRVPETDSKFGPHLALVEHLWWFTKDSLVKTLERAGLKTRDIFYSGTFKGLAHGGEMKNMTAIAELPK